MSVAGHYKTALQLTSRTSTFVCWVHVNIDKCAQVGPTLFVPCFTAIRQDVLRLCRCDTDVFLYSLMLDLHSLFFRSELVHGGPC